MSTDNKVYILQKQFPNAKIGSRVTWNPGYGCYNVGEWKNNHSEMCFFSQEDIDRNPEWFLPEENKSNDSFQWTDELVQQFAREWRGSSGRTSIDSFKQSHTPKPQAENKPQKLFTTEDGVALVGQKGYVLSTDMWTFSPCILPEKPFYGDHNQFKYFHSNEAAEKYIADNKPKNSSCKSPSGNCVNHLACNREDKCIYEAREEAIPQPQKEEQEIENIKKRGQEEAERIEKANHQKIFEIKQEVRKSKPTEQRIEIKHMRPNNYVHFGGNHGYTIETWGEIPEEKYSAIKRCIEYVLNNDAKGYWELVDELLPSQLKYTQTEVDELCEKSFEAGREMKGEWKLNMSTLQYYRYQDYKQSLKQ